MADHRFITHQADVRSEAPASTPPELDRRSGRQSDRSHIDSAAVVLRRWVDPVVDRRGHDPRSRYVERFWLGVLGPSATWLLRRLADELSRSASPTVRVDLVALAQSMGMTYSPGRSSPFAKAIQRCVMFDVAHHTGDGLAVRSRLPTVAERHLRRLPPALRWEHDRWIASEADATDDDQRRAVRLATTMAASGDCLDQIEAQLVAVGVADGVAAQAASTIRATHSAA